MSSRKKALIVLAAIEGILIFAIILLFVFQKLSLMGFGIALSLITVLTSLGVFIVIRKTDPE